MVKAIQTDINTRGTLIRPGFKKLFLVANEKKEYYYSPLYTLYYMFHLIVCIFAIYLSIQCNRDSDGNP